VEESAMTVAPSQLDLLGIWSLFHWFLSVPLNPAILSESFLADIYDVTRSLLGLLFEDFQNDYGIHIHPVNNAPGLGKVIYPQLMACSAYGRHGT
jgi:hypothetical protein